MATLFAKNDIYIEQLIIDENYKFIDYQIYTKITITGKVSVKGIWRRLTLNRSSNLSFLIIKYKTKRLTLSRVLYRKFIGALDPYKVVDHIDRDPLNNSIENLRLVSQHENNCNRGKQNPKSFQKINFSIAETIREKHKNGISRKELQEEFKLSKTNVAYIIRNLIWIKEVHSNGLNFSKKSLLQNNTPKWVDRKEINSIYKNTPKGFVVDHIIPLSHPDICGLHVPWNLQYITSTDNSLKNNLFDKTFENNSWKTNKK